jgi:3-hydroxybutyryl-CoA dehydrogenase
MPGPNVIGVVGAGRMGAGIAQAFAGIGRTVVVVEEGQAAAAAADERITDALRRASQRGLLGEDWDSVRGRISVVDRLDCIPRDSALVVEAVSEDAGLKARLLARTERRVGRRTILASNTSSLSIDGLAQALQDPKRFVGMHFFNPVPASGLVEIVLGSATSLETADAAVGWTRALGKTEIVVQDSPGFASSRLGVALSLEAIRMLEERVASAEAIDTAMCQGYKHPVGPLRLTDLVGLDVRLAIAEHLAVELGPRFTPPALLRDKVARGELGRKTGRGFYSW